MMIRKFSKDGFTFLRYLPLTDTRNTNSDYLKKERDFTYPDNDESLDAVVILNMS